MFIDIKRFILDRIENIVRKGENAAHQRFLQNFLLFSKCFQKHSLIKHKKYGLCGNGLTILG